MDLRGCQLTYRASLPEKITAMAFSQARKGVPNVIPEVSALR